MKLRLVLFLSCTLIFFLSSLSLNAQQEGDARLWLTTALPTLAAKGATPEFGPNVMVFDPSMSSQAIQKQIDAVYGTQEHNEFGQQRTALLFLPGDYSVDVPVGFYTEVIGLGASPDATRIAGNMHADANLEHNNATTTFWRALEGLSIKPTGGTMQWAVSQAVSLRRAHVRGDLVLHQNRGWASGGWMSDTLVDRNVDSGSQQQWISRNCEWKSWTGANWRIRPWCARNRFCRGMLWASSACGSRSCAAIASGLRGVAGKRRERQFRLRGFILRARIWIRRRRSTRSLPRART